VTLSVRGLFPVWLAAKLVAAAVLVAGLGVASEVAGAKQLQVAEVVIMGNDLVAAEDVAATINVGGMNTFAVRGRRLERILGADPAIESAIVRARLPNTVEVVVHERAPAVVWDASGRSVLADQSGLALRDGTREDLPVIHAPDGPAPDPGGRVDAGVVRMAQTLLPRLDLEGLGGGQLEYRPASGASLILPDSARLALGTAEDLEDKLAAYRAIRDFLDRNRTHAQFIDVRFLERPYFR
jgi:cell division protein FtsQ